MNAIQTMMAMKAFALAIESVEGHGCGKCGPEIQPEITGLQVRALPGADQVW